MKIAAITRYKHGQLFLLLKKLGWSQSELARRAKLHPTKIGGVINMIIRPTQEIADKIQAAFGEVGEYLDVLEAWPDGFRMHGKGFKHEQVAEIDPEQLCLDEVPEVRMLVAPDETPGERLDDFEFRDQMKKILSMLQPHYRAALRLKYVYDNSPIEIAEKLRMPVRSVLSILGSAKKKLLDSVDMAHVARLTFGDLNEDEEFTARMCLESITEVTKDDHRREWREPSVNQSLAITAEEHNRRVDRGRELEAELDKLEKCDEE